MTRQEKTLPSAQHSAPSSKKSNTIRIGKSLAFPLSAWRDGILTFLDGIQYQQPIVMSFPELAVGRVHLRLRPDEGYYVAYGEKSYAPPDETSPSVHKHMVRSDDDRHRVERALRLFTENVAFAFFRIDFAHRGVYWLWKTPDHLIRATVLNLPRIVVF